MKKKTTLRDQAIAHYHRSFEQMHGIDSKADLNGISTDEIWEMGDQLLDMANHAAMDAYEEMEAEAINCGGTFSILFD